MKNITVALKRMPWCMIDAFADPLRRRNTLARIGECCVGGLTAVLTAAFAPYGLFLALPAGALAEFLVYEFLLEPLGYAGHYWERGPRDGEEFKRP